MPGSFSVQSTRLATPCVSARPWTLSFVFVSIRSDYGGRVKTDLDVSCGVITKFTDFWAAHGNDRKRLIICRNVGYLVFFAWIRSDKKSFATRVRNVWHLTRGTDSMKRNETQKHEQKTQAQQPAIRVRSRLRAGAVSALLPGCCPPGMDA
jgi:hypothetical protein